MSEVAVLIGTRVDIRRRIVRGLTKEIENGSVGSWSYSEPGNSVAFPRAKVTSILLNESVCCEDNDPIEGFLASRRIKNSSRLLPTK
jgi:hypothetical protein